MCHLASAIAQGVTCIRHNFKFCQFTVPERHTLTLFKVAGDSKNMYCASSCNAHYYHAFQECTKQVSDTGYNSLESFLKKKILCITVSNYLFHTLTVTIPTWVKVKCMLTSLFPNPNAVFEVTPTSIFLPLKCSCKGRENTI